MDKLGTYALVAALKGLTESSRQQRRRESDRWISLQASTLPQLDMTLDAAEEASTLRACSVEQSRDGREDACPAAEPQQPAPQFERPVIRTSYIRQLNERHDNALRRK